MRASFIIICVSCKRASLLHAICYVVCEHDACSARKFNKVVIMNAPRRLRGRARLLFSKVWAQTTVWSITRNLAAVFGIYTLACWIACAYSPGSGHLLLRSAIKAERRILVATQGLTQGTHVLSEPQNTADGGPGIPKSGILAVITTCRRDLEIARASKLWRKDDIHALFMLSDTERVTADEEETLAAENVTVGYYADSKYVADGASKRKHENPSDRRYAMAPFLAHKLRPGFKWLLIMDADMLAYRHGLFQLTQGLDWRQPLWITDAICCTQQSGGPCQRFTCPMCQAAVLKQDKSHPGAASPRILSDSAMLGSSNISEIAAGANSSAACQACTPHTLCKSNDYDEPDRLDFCLKEGWPVAYGGAGALYSAGFFKSYYRHATFQDYESCVATSDLSRSFYPGGDGLLSYCHWRSNLTITSPDPDPSHPQHGRRFGSVSVADITKAASGMLPIKHGASNAVDEKLVLEQQERLRYAVTSHMWRRTFVGQRRMPDYYLRAAEFAVRAYELALVAARIE